MALLSHLTAFINIWFDLEWAVGGVFVQWTFTAFDIEYIVENIFNLNIDLFYFMFLFEKL